MDSQPPFAHSADVPPQGPPSWPAPEGWEERLTWPPPPPPPPGRSPAAPGEVRRGRRRWPVAGLTLVALIAAVLGVAGGAARATSDAGSDAARLAATGNFGAAIAIDEQISLRTGPLFLFASGASAAAQHAEEHTLLAWAAALGREGRIDAAVALYRSERAAPLRAEATAALAALLLRDSVADAARRAYPSAILRLNEIETLAPGTPESAEAAAQLPIDQAGEATALVAAGHAADAVATLDTVVKEGSTQATRTATNLYPTALWVAAEEAIAQRSFKEAAVDLQRLAASYPLSAQGLQAHAMLAAPQAVSGTLVNAAGAAISGPVRLSTHYTAEPGGMYQTSGPFFYSSADSAGDFTFGSVPVGGPYVLEVFTGGNWTTLIDPSTHQPAHPVKVTSMIPVDLTFVVLPS